jgi:hypothetical protein
MPSPGLIETFGCKEGEEICYSEQDWPGMIDGAITFIFEAYERMFEAGLFLRWFAGRTFLDDRPSQQETES